MHDLDETSAKRFYRGENFAGSRRTTKTTGVQDLFSKAQFPNAKLDDLVFDPCGYSVNGLIDEYYYTIHVVGGPSVPALVSIE